MLDLATIEQRLTQAKEDVAFYENAKRILSDPRLVGDAVESQGEAVAAARAYGEVRRSVQKYLPALGAAGMTTAELVSAMQRAGFVFTAKVPIVAVNEALQSLAKSDLAKPVGKRGLSTLWTKGEKA